MVAKSKLGSNLLQRCGEALYGSRWQSELARDLDISDRTMRRWIADAPPDGACNDLRQICDRRLKEIAAARSQLP